MKYKVVADNGQTLLMNLMYDKANYDIAELRTLNYILDYYLDK